MSKKISGDTGYGIIHRKILQSQKLSWKGKLVYADLVSYAGQDRKCWPGINTIASDLGICENSVRMALKELCRERIITIQKTDGKPNIYHFTRCTPSSDEPLHDMSTPLHEVNPTPSTDEPYNKQRRITGKLTEGEAKKETLHNKLKKFFKEDFKKKTGNDYYWQAKDGKNLKQLIEKMTFTQKNGQATVNDERIIKHFLDLLSCPDQWIQDHFEVSILNSQYNSIINILKNKKHGNRYDTEDRDHAEVPGLGESS